MATTTNKETSAWAELEALDAQIAEARRRESEADAARLRARREVDAAKSKLADYFDAVEAEKRPPDDVEEAGLIAGIRDAEAAATESVAQVRLGAAVQRREALEQAREEWGFANLGHLVAELAPRAVAAKVRIEETYEAHRVASAEYGAIRRLGIRVAEIAELPVEDVPANPDRGTDREVSARYARGAVELPLPRTLQARGEVTSGGS